MSFISIDIESIPDHLHCLVNGYIVAGQFVFVELVLEFFRIKFLPVNQAKNSRRLPSLEYGREAMSLSPVLIRTSSAALP